MNLGQEQLKSYEFPKAIHLEMTPFTPGELTTSIHSLMSIGRKWKADANHETVSVQIVYSIQEGIGRTL